MDCERAWRYGENWGRARPTLCSVLSITPDDVGGEAVVTFLERGRCDHRSLIDQIRSAYGRVPVRGKRSSGRAAVAYATWPILDDLIVDPDNSGRWTTRSARLEDDTDPYGPVLDRETALAELARIWASEPRTAAMLLSRAEGKTLVEIGREHGITASRVCQVLARLRPA